MSEVSGRLLDEVIPNISTRQWVLSVPTPLRYLTAYDNAALNTVMTVFMDTLFSYLELDRFHHQMMVMSSGIFGQGSTSGE